MRVCVIGDFDPDDVGHSSVEPGLMAAASAAGATVELSWVSPDAISEHGVMSTLKDADGIFGAPGPIASPDGYLDAIEFAREGQLPYFGCELGLELAVVEFARTILTLAAAHSNEFDPDPRDAIIVQLTPPELVKGKPTPIMGEQVVRYSKDTRLREWMGKDSTVELHRSRFGVSGKYKTQLFRAGLRTGATDETGMVVRALELVGHPYFVVTAFAPHLRADSAAHPLLAAFIKAM